MTEKNYSFGVEEEYFVVDGETKSLRKKASPAFLAELKRAIGPIVTREMLQSQLEIATKPAHTMQEAYDEMRHLRRSIGEIAAEHGLAYFAAGTHPTAAWSGGQQTQKIRYDGLMQDFQMLGERNLLCGMHVHVQLPDADRRVDVMRRMVPYIPLFIALSTSSPFWRSRSTGLMGYRLAAYDELPRTGLPPAFASQAHYDTYIAALVGADVIPDSSFTWWAARPSLKHPTLELRIADCCTLVEDGVAIASLYRALVKRLVDRPTPPVAVDAARYALIEENKWRAQRYGLDCEMVDPFSLEPIDTRTMIARLVEDVMPEAETLECASSVRSTLGILSRGTSADRQLEFYQHARREMPRAEALRDVVRWLTAATIDAPERAMANDVAESASA